MSDMSVDGAIAAGLSLSSPLREDHAMMIDDSHDGNNSGGGRSSSGDVTARSLVDVVNMAKDMTRSIQSNLAGSSQICQSNLMARDMTRSRQSQEDGHDHDQSNDDTTQAAAAAAAAATAGCQSYGSRQSQEQPAGQSTLSCSYGVIVYEVPVKIGFVLRANPGESNIPVKSNEITNSR